MAYTMMVEDEERCASSHVQSLKACNYIIIRTFNSLLSYTC